MNHTALEEKQALMRERVCAEHSLLFDFRRGSDTPPKNTVYFVQGTATKNIKIGTTEVDIRTRIQAMQSVH